MLSPSKCTRGSFDVWRGIVRERYNFVRPDLLSFPQKSSNGSRRFFITEIDLKKLPLRAETLG